VSVILPNVSSAPQSLIDLLSDDSTYYRVNNIHVSEFVKKEFIDLFIKKGNLTLLSVGTKLDQDDCLGITLNGKLILSLRRKSYQELGIEGKPSEFDKKNSDKYRKFSNC
jgi:ribonucleases P/MRP protein subunit RPP40